MNPPLICVPRPSNHCAQLRTLCTTAARTTAWGPSQSLRLTRFTISRICLPHVTCMLKFVNTARVAHRVLKRVHGPANIFWISQTVNRPHRLGQQAEDLIWPGEGATEIPIRIDLKHIYSLALPHRSRSELRGPAPNKL